MNNTVRVIIIDDHEMVLQGLEALLSAQIGIHVIGTFTNGIDAINNYQNLEPDIVLSDINMPIINGFETAERLYKLDDKVRIILISMEKKSAYLGKAKDEGISGYISKTAPIESVVEVIQKVYAGEKCFEPLV